MFSKFKIKNDFFYLNLSEYCCYNNDTINILRNDIKFWDKWLGENTFDYDFLEETFKSTENNILLCFQKNLSNIYNVKINLEGIIIFNNHQNLFYNLILIAKRFNSRLKWVGRNMLRKLNSLLLYNLDFVEFLILTDVSDIPNYYNKLGFTLTDNQYLRKIIDNTEDDLYFIKLEENNFKILK